MTQVSAVYNKDNPFPAHLREAYRLTGDGSAKETMHFVVDIAGSGLTYTCGDSLAIFPRNRDEDVEALLAALGASGHEEVSLKRETHPVVLREALTSRVSLAQPTRRFLQDLAESASDHREQERLAWLLAPEQSEACKAFLDERHYVDLLEEFPSADWSPQTFVDHLRKLVPRLYSIASSPGLYPEEIHLTVAVVRYQTNERARFGVCSTFLTDRVPVKEERFPVFVASSPFGLPPDDATDCIMVGPGTGVAPFRSFIQERVHRGATGRHWLFFGEQHEATDFLYRDDFLGWHRDGHLHRLDLAWSRNQEERIYVQHRMRANAAEIWQWLDGGAHFYVCGDAQRMAKDVEAELLRIFREEGGMDEDAAAQHLKDLKKAKRYQKDVY